MKPVFCQPTLLSPEKLPSQDPVMPQPSQLPSAVPTSRICPTLSPALSLARTLLPDSKSHLCHCMSTADAFLSQRQHSLMSLRRPYKVRPQWPPQPLQKMTHLSSQAAAIPAFPSIFLLPVLLYLSSAPGVFLPPPVLTRSVSVHLTPACPVLCPPGCIYSLFDDLFNFYLSPSSLRLGCASCSPWGSGDTIG